MLSLIELSIKPPKLNSKRKAKKITLRKIEVDKRKRKE